MILALNLPMLYLWWSGVRGLSFVLSGADTPLLTHSVLGDHVVRAVVVGSSRSVGCIEPGLEGV